MARYLIRQANGLLALYSTVIDDLTDSDATEEEIIESFANEAAERERRAVRAWIDGTGEELRRRPLHATEALHRMAHWSPERLAEARAVLTRPDRPEAVPAEPPEKAPAERALLGLLSDLQELFGTGPNGGCIFCPTTRPSHVVGHGKGCRVGAMLARADGEGVVRDLVYAEEQRRTALVDLLGRLGVSFRADDGGCQECFPTGPQAFFDYTAHKVACKVRHVLDGLPADVVAEATARFPWWGEDEDHDAPMSTSSYTEADEELIQAMLRVRSNLHSTRGCWECRGPPGDFFGKGHAEQCSVSKMYATVRPEIIAEVRRRCGEQP